MPKGLEGKAAVITGGTEGIGRALQPAWPFELRLCRNDGGTGF